MPAQGIEPVLWAGNPDSASVTPRLPRLVLEGGQADIDIPEESIRGKSGVTHVFEKGFG